MIGESIILLAMYQVYVFFRTTTQKEVVRTIEERNAKLSGGGLLLFLILWSGYTILYLLEDNMNFLTLAHKILSTSTLLFGISLGLKDSTILIVDGT